MNSFYNVSGAPGTGSQGSSSTMRGEFANIAAGFDKLPSLTGNGGKAVVVNAGGTALTLTSGALDLGGDLTTAAAFTTSGAFAVTLTATAETALTLPTTGTLATLAGSETLSNKTLVAPALGTPASGVLSSCTGYDAGSLAGATLASGVTASSLTSVGSLTSLTVSGAVAIGSAAVATSSLVATAGTSNTIVAYRPTTSANVCIEFRNDTASWFAGQGSTGNFNVDTDGNITASAKLTLTTSGDLSVAGAVLTTASTTSAAGLRIPQGSAPSAPTNGDTWTTNAGFFIRINGVTKTVTLT